MPDWQRRRAVDPDGTTPLHWAAHEGDVARGRCRIRAGAEVNGATASALRLCKAARSGATDITAGCEGKA